MPRWYREAFTREADSEQRAQISHYLESRRRPRSHTIDAGSVVEFMKKGGFRGVTIAGYRWVRPR
jgi:hypothetical protein